MSDEAKALNSAIETQVIKLDVSNAPPSSYASLLNEKERTTIVVNNAGVMWNKPFLQQAPSDLEGMIKTNVHPYTYMTKYAL